MAELPKDKTFGMFGLFHLLFNQQHAVIALISIAGPFSIARLYRTSDETIIPPWAMTGLSSRHLNRNDCQTGIDPDETH